jgi:hypothetical protein
MNRHVQVSLRGAWLTMPPALGSSSVATVARSALGNQEVNGVRVAKTLDAVL